VTEDAGPLRYVRGSHLWGHHNEGDFFDEQDLEALKQRITVPEGEPWEEKAAILPPGGLSFHHWQTYHGSGANTSGSPRLCLSIHLRTQDAYLAADVDEEFK